MLKSDLRAAVKRVLTDHEVYDPDLELDLVDAVEQEGDVVDDEEDAGEEEDGG